jgi:hypothetical protein
MRLDSDGIARLAQVIADLDLLNNNTERQERGGRRRRNANVQPGIHAPLAKLIAEP